MAYTDAANYNTLKSMRGLPIGSIVPWSGAQDTIPTGWVECNGSVISFSRYPLLYNCIGNTYGGITGSTFKLPPLTTQNFGIMDIFQGHFNYLQNKGDAHKPENANKSDDEFWVTVGQSDNGNQSNNTTQDHFTSVDVFGEQKSKPDLVAKYGTFALSTGNVDVTLNVQERKTTDVHLPAHNHNYEGGDADGGPTYNRKNNLATLNSDKFDNDYFCHKDGVTANVSRSTNDPPKNGTEMSSVGSSNTVGTSYRKGGGNITNDGPSGAPQYAATGFTNGDGVSSNDMYSHIGGVKYFFSSLSNEESQISKLSGHRHGTMEYKFESKLSILNPGIVNDVKMSSVTIDNSPGNDFCTINMSSATPTLGMLFIIRAF